MKRIPCPKCDNYLYFDETKYASGQSLVFVCDQCKKQFSIRIGKSKLKSTRKEEKLETTEDYGTLGSVVVVENVFGFKQILPLEEGDNVFGRRCVGTVINNPIESGDMSMDRRHCIINVKHDANGNVIHTLRDADSLTGTFHQSEILGNKEQVRLTDGDVITIGATTLIFRFE